MEHEHVRRWSGGLGLPAMRQVAVATPVLVALALVVTACGGGDEAPAAGDPPASTIQAPDGGSGALRSGDVATNPACALLDAAQVEHALGEKVTEINGTSTPGQFAINSHNCFWITDSGSDPWGVAVNLERDLGTARSAALASVQETIDIGKDRLAGVGDLAVKTPCAVRVVSGQAYLMVQAAGGTDSGRSLDAATSAAVGLVGVALETLH